MLTDCFERPMPTASAITLNIILVVNIYILIWLYDDTPTTQTLLGDNIEIKRQIIAFQTIVLIFAIIFSTIRYTSPTLHILKHWCFVTVAIMLIFDLLFTFSTAKYVLQKKMEKSKTSENFRSFANILAVYFVFKFYAALKIIRFGIDHQNGIYGSQQFNRNIEDIERNTPRESIFSSALPPSYDQCVIESTPPPPYEDIQKYEQIQNSG